MSKPVAVAAVALLACKESVDPLELAGPPAAIAVTAGDNQRGVIGSQLGTGLTVTVTDASGRPSPGTQVAWSASGGSLSQAVDTTDDQGQSTVAWMMANDPGTYSARASVDGAGDVLFTATAQPVAGAIVFRYLDAGGYHACGITTTEQLLCWGYNADGQAGLGTTVQVSSPTLVPGEYRYRRVIGGFYHSCGITLAAEAWCWGNNADGRLGDGDAATQSLVPVPVITAPGVDTLQGDTIVVDHVRLLAQQVAAGEAHTCSIDLAQSLWCWGRNAEGQLGRGDVGSTFPVSRVSSGALYKEVSVGGLHTCAITIAGDGQCWGYNLVGQLGNGNAPTNASSPVAVAVGQLRTDPIVILHSPDPDFPLPPGPFLAAGYDHTCAITASGPTVCWGLNQNGQLGNGSGAATASSPVIVAGGHAFAGVTAGLRHTCALDTDGAAWCWGDNTLGELGDGTNTSSNIPVAVAGGLRFAYLKAGELFTCGVTSEGVAYCWGDNEYGQLGDGSARSSNQPVRVAFQP